MLKKSKSILILIFILAAIFVQPNLSWSQELPLPSGKFGIGHRRFEWTDTSRKEILTAGESMRKVVADV